MKNDEYLHHHLHYTIRNPTISIPHRIYPRMGATKMTLQTINSDYIIRVCDYMKPLPRPRKRLMTGDGETLKIITYRTGEDGI